MKIAEVKDQILLSDFLSKLGHEHVRKSGKELIYHSPFREDRTPSFTVDDKQGKWYDHGRGIGGNIIDLGVLVFQYTSVKDVLRRINELYDGHDLGYLVEKRERLMQQQQQQKVHEVIRVKSLGHNHSIMAYLENRGVADTAIRTGLVKEVYYDFILNNGERRRYFGAGWQNHAGGWEVRSKFAKVCIECRDMLIKEGSTGVTNLFESMMDYLSALADKAVSFKDTTLVMNGLGMEKRAIQYLRDNPAGTVNLFLDHGKGGDACTASLQDKIPNAIDRRSAFSGFADYNEKLCYEIDQRNALGMQR